METELPPLMQEEKKQKKKVVGETKAEQDRLRKKEIAKAYDMLDEIGQESDKKGIPATQKAYKEWEKENFRIKTDRIEWLNTKAKFSKRRVDYYRDVDVIVRYELSFLDVPYGWSVKSEVTDKGIKFVVQDRWGQIHLGGFAPTGLGIYDEQACRSSVNKIDDLITKMENNPPSGIFLPRI